MTYTRFKFRDQPFADQATAEFASANVVQSAAAISTTSDSLLRGHRTVPDASSFQTRRLHRSLAVGRAVRVMPAPTPTGSRVRAGGRWSVGRRRLDLQIKLRPGSTRMNVVGQPAGVGPQSDPASGQRCDGCRRRREANEDVTEDPKSSCTNRITEVSGQRLPTAAATRRRTIGPEIVFAPIAKSGSRRRAIFRTARRRPGRPLPGSSGTRRRLFGHSPSTVRQGQTNDPEFLDRIGTEPFVSRSAKMKRERLDCKAPARCLDALTIPGCAVGIGCQNLANPAASLRSHFVKRPARTGRSNRACVSFFINAIVAACVRKSTVRGDFRVPLAASVPER